MPGKAVNIPAALPDPEKMDVREIARAAASTDIDLVVVLGPTASGKTRYAVGLARALDAEFRTIEGAPKGRCEIISADSRQVYRGMDIGTGKDLSEYGDVPVHLTDIMDAGQQYNVHDFCRDFREACVDIRSRGGFPILCGGTGLYINAVTLGYDFASRTPLSQPRDREGADALKTFFIGTLVDRDTRNSRIDARLDARLQEGMVDEVRGLLEKGVAAQTLISYGLEYKYVTLHLLGELSYDKMRELLGIAIHQFAKRQMTWFRGMERSGARIHWVRP